MGGAPSTRNPEGVEFKCRNSREDAKKMNKKVISDQFWDEPEAGRNGMGNGRPEQDLCVFASWRESVFFVSKNGVRCKPVTDRRSVPQANGNNGAPVCRRLKPCLSATPIRSVEGEGVRNPSRHTQSRSQTGAPATHLRTALVPPAWSGHDVGRRFDPTPSVLKNDLGVMSRSRVGHGGPPSLKLWRAGQPFAK